MGNYSDYTYSSKNPLRKMSHQRRFQLTAQLSSRFLPSNGSMLDYGCADGHMLQILSGMRHDAELTGYEPYPDGSALPKVKIINSPADIAPLRHTFDVVGCFEVLEHFSQNSRAQIIDDLESLLKPGGTLLISVPVEIGFPGFAKGILRRLTDRHNGQQNTTGRLLKCLFGLPIPEVRQPDGAYLNHLGFYFKDLKPQLTDRFELVETHTSPFSWGGQIINSQIFSVWKKIGEL